MALCLHGPAPVCPSIGRASGFVMAVALAWGRRARRRFDNGQGQIGWEPIVAIASITAAQGVPLRRLSPVILCILSDQMYHVKRVRQGSAG